MTDDMYAYENIFVFDDRLIRNDTAVSSGPDAIAK
jgi:hypothetical protein